MWLIDHLDADLALGLGQPAFATLVACKRLPDLLGARVYIDFSGDRHCYLLDNHMVAIVVTTVQLSKG
jgi:hypothetical protein